MRKFKNETFKKINKNQKHKNQKNDRFSKLKKQLKNFWRSK